LIKNDFKVLRSWDSARSSLAGFLSVVAATRCLDFVRTSFHRYTQKKNEPGPECSEGFDLLDFLESDEKTPDERLHLLQVAETLGKCLEDLCQSNHLKPIDRQLVELRAMGMEFKEVAKILGIQDGNAMTRFFRLKEQLVASLEKAGVTRSDIHE
jgi:DNA-directed RNA polymerase specialized sigma24 family protein